MSLPMFFATLTFLVDGSIVAASFLSAYWIRFHSGWLSCASIPPLGGYLFFLLVVVPTHWLVFKYTGLYRRRRGISGVDELTKVFRGTATASILVAASTFLIRSFSYSRLVIAFTFFLSTVALWMARGLLRRIQIFLRRRGTGLTRLLLVGTGQTARAVLSRIKANPDLGYQVVGVIAEKAGPREVEGVRVVGRLSRLPELLSRLQVEEVLFALPADAHAQLIPLLVKLTDLPARMRIVSDLFGVITHPLETDMLLGMPLFELKKAPLNRPFNRLLKRMFDLVFSAGGLFLLNAILLFPLIALGVKLSSPGPVFFRQKRVGRDGRIFEMLKFRSMKMGSETASFTQKDDPRRTAFGAFLRRTSLDELPQLINVLKGEMSLVGPRPEVPSLVRKFEKDVPRYFERHQVKAGITGWAQVNGLRGNTSLAERVSYDIYYIENWSLWFDVQILMRTVLDILEHRHAY